MARKREGTRNKQESKTRLQNARFNRLSDICSDIAQVALASVAIPALIDRFNFPMILSGLAITLALWTFSILLVRTRS